MIFMYQFRVVDPKVIRRIAIPSIIEARAIEKKLKNEEYRDRCKKKNPNDPKYKKGARRDAIRAWAEKKGISGVRAELEVCPHCLRNFKKSLADKQRQNNREGGISCIPCIMGWKRKDIKK